MHRCGRSAQAVRKAPSAFARGLLKAAYISMAGGAAATSRFAARPLHFLFSDRLRRT